MENNKYIEAIKQMVADGQVSQEVAEKYFTELKESESEDDKIRKAIKKALQYWCDSSRIISDEPVTLEEAIAWLEKQGKHAKFRDSIQVGDKVTRNKDGVLVNLSQLNRVAKKDEKQGEQKPADKVEPKFHEGEWVVNRFGDAWHIDSFDSKNYQVSNGDNYCYFPIKKQNEMHLWTIQDAKDGDVLVVPPVKGSEDSEQIFIFKEIKDREYVNNAVEYYCRVVDNEFCMNEKYFMGQSYDHFVPATKEQRDLLFKKMHEAGYEWDAEKKELKKIKQKPKFKVGQTITSKDGSGVWYATIIELNDYSYYCKTDSGTATISFDSEDKYELVEKKPAWGEEDEKLLKSALWHLTNSISNGNETNIDCDLTNWLKSLKDRVQPRQDWSEEDKYLLDETIDHLKILVRQEEENGDLCNRKKFYQRDIEWLKAIKDRLS